MILLMAMPGMYVSTCTAYGHKELETDAYIHYTKLFEHNIILLYD